MVYSANSFETFLWPWRAICVSQLFSTALTLPYVLGKWPPPPPLVSARWRGSVCWAKKLYARIFITKCLVQYTHKHTEHQHLVDTKSYFLSIWPAP